MLCLGMASGPARATAEEPETSAFADQVLVSREALVAAVVDALAESASSGVLFGEGRAADVAEESSAPLQFGISHGASLIPTGLTHSGSGSLGLRQQWSAANSLSAWLSTASTGWFPTLSYTLEQQGSGEFVAAEGFGWGLGDAGSSLSMHNVDLGWGGELWHAGYLSDGTVQRQPGQGSTNAGQSGRDSVYLGFSLAGDLDLAFDLGVEWARDSFFGDLTRWHTRGISANWALAPRVTVHAGLTESRAEASEILSRMSNRMADLTFTYHLDSVRSPTQGTRQLFLRLDQQTFKTDATEFELAGTSYGWSINVGFVLSAF